MNIQVERRLWGLGGIGAGRPKQSFPLVIEIKDESRQNADRPNLKAFTIEIRLLPKLFGRNFLLLFRLGLEHERCQLVITS